MNEKINELRLEAGISRLHEVPYMVAVNKEGEIIEPLEGLQKFAELIVRECARVIDRGDGEMSSMAETIWCNVCRDDILKHFGVEK